jgi:hypothetical protein
MPHAKCPRIGRKRAKILVKYGHALGALAKAMISKSQDRLHRHGIFPTCGPLLAIAPEGMVNIVEAGAKCTTEPAMICLLEGGAKVSQSSRRL